MNFLENVLHASLNVVFGKKAKKIQKKAPVNKWIFLFVIRIQGRHAEHFSNNLRHFYLLKATVFLKAPSQLLFCRYMNFIYCNFQVKSGFYIRIIYL